MAMKTGDAFEAKELAEEVKKTLPNVYVDDLLMSLKYFIDEDIAHSEHHRSRDMPSLRAQAVPLLLPGGRLHPG